MYNWVSVSKPPSASNVEFCLFGTCVCTYVRSFVTASTAGSAGHSYHTPLLPLVSCPDHTSHEENGLVNQVEFLGPITRMW